MKRKKTNIVRLLQITVIAGILSLNYSNYLQAQTQRNDIFEEFSDDYKPDKKSNCSTCSVAENCNPGAGCIAPPWLKYGFLFIAAAAGAVYLARKFSWKIAALLLMLVLFGFIPKKKTCTSNTCQSETTLLAQAEIPKTQEEFQEIKESNNDDFEEFAETDEFQELSDDEFSDFSEQTEITEEVKPASIWANRNFTLSVLVLFLTLIAGILIRFKTTRKLKIFMLLGTLIYLGFINGACPCMISSFQNVILYIVGVEVHPMLMLWFLGLIPLTYFFGRVWCGWVCHLGALQEIVFRPSLIKVLQNRKSQVILKWIRIATLVILIAQIAITRTNIFIHYDPFKVAFNLFSANTLGYVLVGIMLISSVLIYRPFCRAFCPVGLLLGWVSHIPGSAKLAKNDTCIDCKSCSNSCKYNAMVYENKKSYLHSEDCILCGDCMDSCKFTSIEITGIAK